MDKRIDTSIPNNEDNHTLEITMVRTHVGLNNFLDPKKQIMKYSQSVCISSILKSLRKSPSTFSTKELVSIRIFSKISTRLPPTFHFYKTNSVLRGKCYQGSDVVKSTD